MKVGPEMVPLAEMPFVKPPIAMILVPAVVPPASGVMVWVGRTLGVMTPALVVVPWEVAT